MANQAETIGWLGDSVTNIDMLTEEYNLTYTVTGRDGDVLIVDVFGHSADIEMFKECADGLDLLT
jgi:hypothetical protein